MIVFQNIENRPILSPSYTTPGHRLKGHTTTPQRHLPNYAHSSLTCNSQKLETTYMPLSQRLNKENVVHLHKSYSAVKNNDFLKYVDEWMGTR